MERIVHIDLKGAPLKVHYFKNVIALLKSWGATGLLIEWEDTFPYSSVLTEIGSMSEASLEGLYSLQDVHEILNYSNEQGLEVIQLVQTIGHMEFALKHPTFRHLRENPRTPAVLCPCKVDSRTLVRQMVEQVLEVQPEAKYIHIGADEVWHLGVCSDCQNVSSTKEMKALSLYLDHIKDLAVYVKEIRPNIVILIWDDMLRSINVESLRSYSLGELVEPVVWHYGPKECFRLEPSMWNTYKQVFPKVWAGSAFKGANGSCQMLSPVSRYVSNTEAWIAEMQGAAAANKFSGIILTGWSRYDHYATLCELLPVSLPSLYGCLKKLISCNDSNGENDSSAAETLPPEQWPGEEVARCVHSVAIVRGRCQAFLHGDLVLTWLNPWQLDNCYSNPSHLDSIVYTAEHLLKDLNALEADTSRRLKETIGAKSADEWMGTFVAPLLAELNALWAQAKERSHLEASVAPARRDR